MSYPPEIEQNIHKILRLIWLIQFRTNEIQHNIKVLPKEDKNKVILRDIHPLILHLESDILSITHPLQDLLHSL